MYGEKKCPVQNNAMTLRSDIMKCVNSMLIYTFLTPFSTIMTFRRSKSSLAFFSSNGIEDV